MEPKNLIPVLALIFALGGCSSSKVSDGEGAEGADVAIADTDSIPLDMAEVPSADLPSDEEALKMLENAAPEAEAPVLAEVDAAPLPSLDDPIAPAFDSPAPQAAALPDTLPSPEPSYAAAPDASFSSDLTGEFETYTVQANDTLMKIAFETYGDLYQWKKIYSDNKNRIADPNALSAGVVLQLERPSMQIAIDRNGERYRIKTGDTLGSISRDIYGTPKKWRRLWDNNRQLIRDPNRIFAGFYLYYTMTDEDRREYENLKQDSLASAPAPGMPARMPASVGGVSGAAAGAAATAKTARTAVGNAAAGAKDAVPAFPAFPKGLPPMPGK